MPDKISKKEAEYEDPACWADHCKNCIYFELMAPKHCSRVQGHIEPEAVCKLFMPNYTLHG